MTGLIWKLQSLFIKQMYLVINTTDQLFFGLINEKGELTAQFSFPGRVKSDYFIKQLKDFLKKNEIETAKLNGLGVVNGPGSFTAVRTGVVFANSLAFALNIPIVSLRSDQFKDIDQLITKIYKKISQTDSSGRLINPIYDQAPGITRG
ncbi:MAG TPA: hypothetical protein VGA49_02895 [Patescibacteria group bacterium]